MSTNRTIVWFRRDLRLADNPALFHAAQRGEIIPVYVHAPEEEGRWAPGGAARVWLHHSLDDLGKSLRKHHGNLTVRIGTSLDELRRIARETNANAVYWNRLYDPQLVERDIEIKKALKDDDLEAKSFGGTVLWEPMSIKNKQKKPFQVFTPYWKHLLTLEEPEAPYPTPTLSIPDVPATSLPLQNLDLLPKRSWGEEIASYWEISEQGALDELDRFIDSRMADYEEERNRPDHVGTSRMSAYLHQGNIGPRTIWHRCREAQGSMNGHARDSAQGYLRELGWREFSHHILYHFPKTPTHPLRESFEVFPWSNDDDALHAWQTGNTGYPIVDAGMRELYATGWMHNRVRMIVGSFLTKHLLLNWLHGAEWFWDTLFDADLANNTMGWQWVGGCGADASPYFRIFNPMTQGKKFDPDGSYIRRWVPELGDLPTKHIYAPWEAPQELLKKHGVVLGESYPEPIVEHRDARECALDAFEKVKAKSASK